MVDRASLLATQYEVKRSRAGWMAVSVPGSQLLIGVVARTEDEAGKRFAQELEKWVDLLDQPDRS